jgi:hypothetical protein
MNAPSVHTSAGVCLVNQSEIASIGNEVIKQLFSGQPATILCE